MLLAGYQITEVAICADVAAAGFLPRLAFLIVTWLPALGLLLIAQLRRPRSRTSHAAAYGMLAASAGMVAWIVVDRSFATASVCNAVYAHYAHVMPRFLVYAWYYWLGLAGMAVCSAIGAKACHDERRKAQLALLCGGTLAFVAPSLALSWVVPVTRGALPSILCHFALLLAVCLPVGHNWLVDHNAIGISFPDQEGGQDGSPRGQGETGRSTGGVGRTAEEVDEDPRQALHVVIGKDTDHITRAQHSQ